jgi:hypothetical protein
MEMYEWLELRIHLYWNSAVHGGRRSFTTGGSAAETGRTPQPNQTLWKTKKIFCPAGNWIPVIQSLARWSRFLISLGNLMLMQVLEKILETRKTCELNFFKLFEHCKEISEIYETQKPTTVVTWAHHYIPSWATGIQPTFTQATSVMPSPIFVYVSQLKTKR